MLNFLRSQTWQYGFALLSVSVVWGLTVLGQFNSELTIELFCLAVAISASFGKTRAGILAALLCTFAIRVDFTTPIEWRTILTWSNFLQFTTFIAIVIMVNRSRMTKLIENTQLFRNLQSIQQQKAESFASLNAFLASSPVGFAFLNCDRQYVLINESLASTHHLPIADHLGKTVQAVLSPAFAEVVDARLQQVLKTKTAIVNQEESDHDKVWLSNYFPVCAESGDLLGVGATVLDITERKQDQNALWDALQRLNSHVDNTPLAVLEWDRDFRLIRWSQQAEVIFGWTADEVMGKHPQDWEFIVPQDLVDVQAKMKDLVTGVQRRSTGQNRNYRKDGSVIVTEWYNSALFDEFEQVETILSLVLDVTQRVQLEAEQQRILNREQAARKEAEQANRTKDEFLAVLSHELRSPLNPILGWAKILQTGRLSPERTLEALATIERNAKLQSQLIEDLLDVSRILSNKLALNLFPVDLAFIISSAIDTVRLTADAKAIRIETYIAPNTGQVLGDSARLQQVFWNLLSNAIKFTPERGRIEIHLEQVGTEAQIRVKDTGKGINPEFLPYIFDYFRQEDGSTTRKFGGLGLGLAIVQHILERHQGRIWADSLGDGQGATFTLRLPLLSVERTRNQQQPAITKTPIQLEAEPLIGLTVLTVDNDADMLTLITVALKQAGAEVIAATSAEIAIKMLQCHQPDVLISDIGMPECNGYELIQQIRSSNSIPAIALTAYAGDGDQQLAIESGFDQHLAKPVEPQQLIMAIVELLQSCKTPV